MHRYARVVLLLAATVSPAAAQDAPRPLDGYLQAWSSHDVERIASYFTEDAVYEDVTLGEIHRGRTGIRKFAEETFAALPGFALAQRALVANERGATLEWVMTGTERVSGRRFAVRGVSVMELEGGRIRRNADYWNMADFQRQLRAPSTAGSAPDGAAASPLDTDRIAAAVDSIVGGALAGGEAAGMSVAVVRGRDTLVLKGYGKADLEHDVATPPRAVYQIGSVTKQFTAAAILQLQEQGKLALDDDITRYLPGFPTRGHRVTIRRLLDHTSGIRSYSEIRELGHLAFDAPSPDSTTALIGAQGFDFEPGTAMAYNNSGYFLLGRIIERVSGMPYEAYVRQNLLERAGMPDSRYCSTTAVVPRLARGYDWDDDTLRVARSVDPAWPFAAGALCATVGDLVAWTHALHGGRILGPAAYRELLATDTLLEGARLRYARGVAVDSVLGHRAVRHGGGIPGHLSDVAHFPDDSLTVVVLVNTRGPVNPGTVSRSIVRVVLGDRSPSGVAPRAPLTDYVGEYRGLGPGGEQVLTIGADTAGRLTLRAGDRPARALTYYGGEVFGSSNEQTGFDERYVFVRETGRVARLRVDGLVHYTVLARAPATPGNAGPR